MNFSGSATNTVQLQPRNTFASASNLQLNGIMSPDEIQDILRNPRGVGTLLFTYSVGGFYGTTTRYSTWSPRPGVQGKSLADLIKGIPGGDGASGLRLVFSGPGFSIGGQAFDESDFARLRIEFNDQIDRILMGRNRRTLFNSQNVHVQVLVYRHERASNAWIFS